MVRFITSSQIEYNVIIIKEMKFYNLLMLYKEHMKVKPSKF